MLPWRTRRPTVCVTLAYSMRRVQHYGERGGKQCVLPWRTRCGGYSTMVREEANSVCYLGVLDAECTAAGVDVTALQLVLGILRHVNILKPGTG